MTFSLASCHVLFKGHFKRLTKCVFLISGTSDLESQQSPLKTVLTPPTAMSCDAQLPGEDQGTHPVPFPACHSFPLAILL